MAGEKLTQQTEKTSGFAADDLIHIVDVSLNPPGTSFKAEIGKILASLSVVSLTRAQFQSMISGHTQSNNVWYQVTDAVSNTRTLLIVYGSISVDGVIAYDVRSGEIGRWKWTDDTWKPVNPGFKVYTALLTQTGTDAPTAIVLENTLGETPTFQYNSPGNYSLLTSGSIFTANKTFFISSLSGDLGYSSVALARISNTEVIIELDSGEDIQLDNASIEIRVYP